MASYFSPAYDKFTPNTWDAVNNIAIPKGVSKKHVTFLLIRYTVIVYLDNLE